MKGGIGEIAGMRVGIVKKLIGAVKKEVACTWIGRNQSEEDGLLKMIMGS